MSRRFLFAVTTLAFVPSSQAADIALPIVNTEPVPVASGVRGVVEVGVLGRSASEDDDAAVTFGGVYGAFALQTEIDALVLGVDGYGEWLSIDDADPDVTNGSLGVLGAQLGTRIDDLYIGAFGAVASYPNAENDEQFFGYAAGVQAAVGIDQALLIGRIGYAYAPNEDFDLDSEGFVGPFVEGGVAFALTEDFGVLANLGYGYSANFDVADDPGEYVSWGIKAAYRLPGEFNLNLVASYEGMHAFDDDDESNTIHTVKFGISIPFGDSGSAMDALRPLASPTAPFRASVSADVM